jgi:hypothetical protein
MSGEGTSGNRRGRPPKKRWLAVPNQIARSALEISKQVVTVPGPNGPRQAARGDLVIEAIYMNAMKGKASAQKQWVELMRMGFADLVERHPGVAVAEAMRQIYEDPTADPPPGLIQALDEWIRRIKRL